jgi:hypothetical protein
VFVFTTYVSALQITHRPKLATGKRRAINPKAIAQTRRSIENFSFLSENEESPRSEILAAAAARNQTPPRPFAGNFDPERHRILPYTDEDVIPFTEALQLQYDAPILRTHSVRSGEDSVSDSRAIPRNRSAPVRIDPVRRGQPSSPSIDDDDMSVDTAMASYFGKLTPSIQ